MTLIVNTRYSTYPDCYISTGQYQYDGSTCIQLYNREDGPIAYITTCIPNGGVELLDNESFIDTNNCPWAIEFIKKYNLGEVTDKLGYSGFCSYPVVQWNMAEIEKYKQ